MTIWPLQAFVALLGMVELTRMTSIMRGKELGDLNLEEYIRVRALLTNGCMLLLMSLVMVYA